MPKFKINFSGFAYIRADSPAEAIEIYKNLNVRGERHIDSIEEEED